MKYRDTLMVAAIASVWLGIVSMDAQVPAKGPSASARPYTPRRTADGQPDIQGMWEGGAPFEDKDASRVEVLAGPPECAAGAGAGTNTECQAYPELWTTAQRTGVIGAQGSNGTSPRRRGLIDPADGRLPWTTAGKAKYLDVVAHILDPQTLAYVEPNVRCMLPGLPRGASGLSQFLQTPGYVVQVVEFNHVTRIIPLDGRPHVDPAIRLFMGDSVGHWEGTTLVVDTTNFTGRTWHNMTGAIQSNAMHTVERFTIVDADTMDYQVTIDDPKLFSKPWTTAGSFNKAKPDGMQSLEIYESACAEGLKALDNILERPDRPLPPDTPPARR